MGKTFIELLSQLPPESGDILRELIFQKRLAVRAFTPGVERLYIAGLIRRKQVGENYYIEFNSWYVELMVYIHSEQLGIPDKNIKKIDIDELMPPTSSISMEAYRLINEIENLTRNYITIQLCVENETHFHFLAGRGRKYNPEKQVEDDAYERAEDWQNRSRERGLRTELNPLIAYLSTRDLANLIEELGAEMRSPAWLRIAQAIRKLSDVRDAVMHNQVIDDGGLLSLYELHKDIYYALSENLV